MMTHDRNGRIAEQLFDASRDALERRNFLSEEPAVSERLRGAAERYLASEPPWGETPTLELDEVQLNQLRALGYKLP